MDSKDSKHAQMLQSLAVEYVQKAALKKLLDIGKECSKGLSSVG